MLTFSGDSIPLSLFNVQVERFNNGPAVPPLPLLPSLYANMAAIKLSTSRCEFLFPSLSLRRDTLTLPFAAPSLGL
jgi:hypothetical protein